MKWEVASTKKEMNGDVPVITKELVGHVDNSSYPEITVDIQLTLSTPADAKGPVPVIMEFGWRRAHRRWTADPRRKGRPAPGPTWQQQVLAKGWGFAQITPTAFRPTTARA